MTSTWSPRKFSQAEIDGMRDTEVFGHADSLIMCLEDWDVQVAIAAGKKLAGFKPDAGELTSALKVLAKDGGKVATGELRKVVNNLESMKIESADLDTVIRVLDPKDDEEVDADALAKALCK